MAEKGSLFGEWVAVLRKTLPALPTPIKQHKHMSQIDFGQKLAELNAQDPTLSLPTTSAAISVIESGENLPGHTLPDGSRFIDAVVKVAGESEEVRRLGQHALLEAVVRRIFGSGAEEVLTTYPGRRAIEDRIGEIGDSNS